MTTRTRPDNELGALHDVTALAMVEILAVASGDHCTTEVRQNALLAFNKYLNCTGLACRFPSQETRASLAASLARVQAYDLPDQFAANLRN